MKTAIPRNNFSSGLISQQLSGRFDLPVFTNGLKVLENFIINLNGSLSKRTGFEFILKTQQQQQCFYLKFVFNQEQVYLLEFNQTGTFAVLLETEDNKLVYYKENDEIKYFSYPYNFEELKDIKTAQNGDVIYFCHRNYTPKTLTRTYSNNTIAFAFANVSIDTGTDREDPFSIDGNPSCCCFFQQRLFYSGFTNANNKIWASDTGYYNRFTTNRSARADILEIDGFNFVLNEINLPLNWIKATTVGLILGSRQGIAICKTDSGTLSPFNFACNLINRDGASEQEPITVGTVLIYIENTNRRLRALQYNWDVNSFVSTNLNIYNPELLQENIKTICYNQDEKELVYVLTESGKLYYLLFSSAEMFFAWGKIKLYQDLDFIETVERFNGGTNLFLIGKDKCFLRLTEDFYLKPVEEFINNSQDNKQLHQNYYDYLLNNINNFNYLDKSSNIKYKYDNSFFGATENQFKMIKTTNTDGYLILGTTEVNIFDNPAEKEFFVKIKTQEKQIQITLTGNGYYYNEDNNLYQLDFTTNNGALENITAEEIEIITVKKNILDEIDNNLYADGNEYSICGDGYFYPNITINNGKIELPKGVAIGEFKIGYNYNSTIKTMNLGGMLDNYNTLIAKKNILKVYLRLYNSWGGEVGTNCYDLKKINYQKTEYQRFSEPHTLIEQDIRISISDSWEFNKSYWVVSQEAFPFNINTITILQEVNQ